MLLLRGMPAAPICSEDNRPSVLIFSVSYRSWPSDFPIMISLCVFCSLWPCSNALETQNSCWLLCDAPLLAFKNPEKKVIISFFFFFIFCLSFFLAFVSTVLELKALSVRNHVVRYHSFRQRFQHTAKVFVCLIFLLWREGATYYCVGNR